MNKTTCMGLATGLLALLSALLTTGCTAPAVHPNQINEFDGATYDSLTLAHGALTSLRTSVASNFAAHSGDFNEAATAYNQAVAAYALYRDSQQQTSVENTIRDLTLAIVLLETTLQKDLHVNAANDARIRSSARKIRSEAVRAHVSVSDIMTELQIAAAIAATVAPDQPYAKLAQSIVQATASAMNAMNAASGMPIDMASLPAIALLN